MKLGYYQNVMYVSIITFGADMTTMTVSVRTLADLPEVAIQLLTFAADKKVSAAVTKTVEAKAIEKAKALNKLLVKKNWLGPDADRIARIRAKLAGANWLEAKAEMKTIEAFYHKNIANITHPHY